MIKKFYSLQIYLIFYTSEALAKVLNNNVAANFSLRVLFYFNTLQTQAKACGYQNRTFARASSDYLYTILYKISNYYLKVAGIKRSR